MKFNALSRLSTATTIFFSLATLTSIVSATENAADAGTTPPCGGTLVSVCCKSAAGPYPRGYVGSGCTAAPAYGSCPTARPKHICCQKLYDDGVAYYCGQPN